MKAQQLKKIPAWIYYITGASGLGMCLWMFLSHFTTEASHPWLELGAGWMLAGLLCIWCGMDYNRSPVIRFFCMLFFGLIAFIHWLEFFRGHLPVYVPITQSLPFVLLISAELIICNLVKE